jgi:CBS domain-containing protein
MIGMAGIVSGAMRAPLTGTIFAVELTGHYQALPEAIAASVGAYAVSVLVMHRSILTEKIARRGRHILQEYTVDALEFMQADQIMTRDPVCLSGTMPVSEATAYFTGTAAHRSYPVVDAERRLVGLVSRSDALNWEMTGSPEDASLADVLSDASQPFGFTASPIGEIADLMIETGIGRIPIVDPDTLCVVGILTRHDLLRARHVRTAAESGRSR